MKGAIPFSDMTAPKKQPKSDITEAPRTMETFRTLATKLQGQEEENKIALLHNAVKTSKILPPELGLHDDLGKNASNCHHGLMWPTSFAVEHEAAQLLTAYSTQGCPVDTGKNWDIPVIMEALRRGSHQSTTLEEAREYLRQETMEKEKGGFLKTF